MTTINADALRQKRVRLLSAGYAVPPLLDARLQWTEAEGTARYVRMMSRQESVRPRMLPAQACARWSTTDPPLPTFPRDLPLLVMPWPGCWWLKFDLAGIEARLGAAYSGDREDLDAFAKGYDLHTITACMIYKKPLPPDLVNPHGPACTEWQQSWANGQDIMAPNYEPPWAGSKDRRRQLAKNTRFGCLYSFDKSGKSILGQPGIERTGATRDELVSAAKRYIAGKTVLGQYKQQLAAELARAGVAYTFLGARRRLYGDARKKAKLGWNFMCQGAVSDMMNSILLAIQAAWPESRLVCNRHDGAEIEFPLDSTPASVYAQVKPMVERRYRINGNEIVSAAEWRWIDEWGEAHVF